MLNHYVIIASIIYLLMIDMLVIEKVKDKGWFFTTNMHVGRDAVYFNVIVFKIAIILFLFRKSI